MVFNVAPRALGVILYKQVRNRYVEKRIIVRIEHVQPSKCADDFRARVSANAAAVLEAKKNGTKVPCLKRQPAQPISGHFVSTKDNEPVLLSPIPYEVLL